MSELGNCPKCGSADVAVVAVTEFGVSCRCCGLSATTEELGHLAAENWESLRQTYAKAAILAKVMRIPIMQKCLIDLKQGQGIDLDEGKTLIQAFVATGMAKQGDFEAAKDQGIVNLFGVSYATAPHPEGVDIESHCEACDANDACVAAWKRSREDGLLFYDVCTKDNLVLKECEK